MTSAARAPSLDLVAGPGPTLQVIRSPLQESLLRNARRRAGLTVAQLATAMHVSRPTVSMWERGDRPVGRHYWPMLGTALRMTDAQITVIFAGAPPSRLDGVHLPGLALARQGAQLTQRALAQRVGVAPTTLSMWESARVRAPRATLPLLQAELGVELAALTAEPPAAVPDDRPLRRYRRAAGMTRAEAAAHLGVSLGALARYEAARRPTPVQVVRRMAQVYGRRVEEVLAHSGLVLPALPAGRRWHAEELPGVLLALRTREGLSRVGLGRAVGRSGQVVANWEAGRTRPAPSMCRRLEVVFRLSVGQLPD